MNTPSPDPAALDQVAAEARACTLCAAHLPLGPLPVLRVSTTARLLITSQAPGTRVHATGIPFNDASGDRLRAWLGINRDEFYDVSKVNLLPMGLCYPGRLPQGGDKPPRRECAPLWHPRVLPLLAADRLTLLVGSYAQVHTLGPANMTERLRNFRAFLPDYFPLPHPSWRTIGWAQRNPWFEAEVLPALREAVARVMAR